MAARTSVQPAPANFAPLVAVAAVIGGVVATFFQLPGAVIIALGITVSSFFYNAPPALNPKEPAPDAVQRAQRRWSELRWRALIPNGDWLLNHPNDFKNFSQRAQAFAAIFPLPPKIATVAGYALQGIGFLGWFITPTRFIQQIAVGAGLIALTLPANLSALAQWLPPEMLAYDLVWVNAVLAYGVVMGVDAAVRRSAAVYDPSPGVSIMALLDKATGKATGEKDGGAWRSIIGFTLLGAVTGIGAMLILLVAGLEFWVVPLWLFGLGIHLVVTAACMHGVARNDGLAAWRDKVAARAEWAPRWEAMKYPEVMMVDHQRVGSFVVDTFEAPPSLGSAKAINLYNTVVPYLAAGGDVTVAMLTVEASDSQGEPIPGSAHATRFRVVVAPGDAQVQTLDPKVDVEELKLAAEVGAFTAARELNAQVPILLDLTAAHAPDSTAAVWETSWTVPLASAATVAWSLGVDHETGIFSEGRSTFFGDFEGATLSDKSLPGRMEKAAYEARWAQRWTDSLKQGEKQPHLQYGAIKREKLGNIELTYEPFLVGQGLSPAQFFSKDMCKRILTTLKAAPFLTVVGITGALAGNLGPGVRHGQGFAVVHAATALPSNPAEIASPGPRARDVAKWVMGGLLNRAFEDAKLPYPEVITAESLTRPQSKGHVWKVHLRLYDGVTAAVLKQNATKFAQSLGGVRWLRFEESEHGAYVVMGIPPHTEGVKFANPQALAYCDKLDWAQAFQEVGVRSVTDGASPMMLENAPHATNPKITRLVFSMPQGFNLGKVMEATDKLRSATANDYVDIRPGETPDKFVILASETNPIPFPAKLDWESSADIAGKAEHSIPFAYTTDGSTVSLNWKNDFHMMVLGGSGSGKSSFIQVLIVGALLRGCELYIMDPTKGATDFEFAAPWVRGFAREGQHLGAGELTQHIGMEMTKRKQLNSQHGVGNYRDLPEEVRPRHMFVVIDEFQSLIKEVSKGALKAPDTTDEVELALFEERKNINDGVRKLAYWVGKFGREARAYGITVVLAGQGIKAPELEAVGLQGMKTNFSRVALGKMTHGDMASAFKDTSILPNLGTVIPQGRGIFEGTSGDPLVIQSWFEPGGQVEMARKLAELVPPIDESDRIDVAALEDRVKSAAPMAFGAVMEDEFVVDDEDEQNITLDASQLGVDLGDLMFIDEEEQSIVSLSKPTTSADSATSGESFEGMTAADFLEPEEQFTLEEPPTEHNLSAQTPEEETEHATAHIDGERPLFHEGQFVDTPQQLAGRIVIGEDIIFGENSPTGDGFETGWPEGDALQLLLRANPDITEIVWADRILDELDDIGIAREDIARDICTQYGATLTTHHDQNQNQNPAPEPPTPTPVNAEAPALFEMDDFDIPAPNVPDMGDADSIFDGPRPNAPETEWPSF